MRPLQDREKRTIRIAGVAILIYLVAFFGVKSWNHFETKRTQYEKSLQDAERLKREIQRYQNRVVQIEKLQGTFRIDPAKLSKTSLVAEASAAIQKAAQSGGIQLGPIRESHARASAKELTSMQLEGAGQVPALLAFLHALETTGYPLVVDSIQITSEPRGPGMIKLNLSITVLDYEQWKKEGKRNA